jgi:RNA polymerase sigma-70 factor (ECF subfamily)
MRKTVLESSPARLLSLVTSRDISEGEVARALVAGEPWAISETWRRFAPMVLMLSERCLGSRAAAEDVTQETFFRLFRKADTLRDPDRLRSFIYSFAVRLLQSELRRRRVRGWLSFARPEAVESAYAPAPDMVARDLLHRFHALLDRLVPSERLVFVLRRVESMTVLEIASHMGTSTSTVKRTLSRANQRLTRWLEAEPALLQMLEEGHLAKLERSDDGTVA